MVDDEKLKAVLAGGVNLADKQRLARSLIREKWKKDAGDLLDAHWCVASVIADLVNRKSGVPGNISPSLEGRLAQSAAFIQGIDICEVAIAEGLYVQAGTLLRQEMETLAAVIELRLDKRADGKTPNVKHLPMGLSRQYGELSAIAHVADRSWLDNIIARQFGENVVGASVIPRYEPSVARTLYLFQITFMLILTFEIAEIFGDLYAETLTDLDEKMLGQVAKTLMNSGHLVQKTP